MIRYLLDTNIVSEPVRQRPDPNVLSHLTERVGEMALASVSWHELLYGYERMPAGKRKAFLGQYLTETVGAGLPILPFDADAAAWLARERVRLQQASTTRPLIDSMIAATAATRSLILVTRNVRDFEGYAGLHVENWFELR
ncbi:MAG: type II toxin-antitoxin system VapC family toxin [Bacteroidota bacterium]